MASEPKGPAAVRSKRRKSKVGEAQIARRWWLAKDEDLWASILATVERLKPQHDKWLTELRECERLYEDTTWLDLLDDKNELAKVTYNVSQSCADTLAARISKSKPRPMFVTDDAEWKLARRAKKRTAYVSGVYQKAGAYDAAQSIFLDAVIGGHGCMQWLIEDGKILCERVLPEELIIDENEARYGKTRGRIRRRIVSRDTLVSQYPDHEGAIEAAPDAEPYDREKYEGSSDIVEVLEAWRLPTAKGAGDGRWAVVIDGQTLDCCEYDKDYLPFIDYRWSIPRRGFRGVGLIRQLAGIQHEINHIVRRISIGIDRVANPRVFYAKGTINPATLTKQIGGLVPVDTAHGPMPIISTAVAFNPETYQYLRDLYSKAFELSGLSQLSASGKKPAGVDAAVAMRELQDIESERFSLPSQRFEQMFVDSAPIVIDLTRDLIEEDAGFSIRTRAGKLMRTVKAAEVVEQDDDDLYDTTVYPVSNLPKTPVGRRQEIAEWQKQGWVTPDEAMQLMEMPDTEKFVSLRISALELAQMVVEKILDDGEEVQPEPEWDLKTTFRIGHQELLRAQLKNAPEDAQEALRKFLQRTKVEIDKVEAANAPPPPPPPPGEVPPPDMMGGPPVPGGEMPPGLAA